MRQSIQPLLVLLFAALLISLVIWGNHLVFKKLVDIRHQNAPMPSFAADSVPHNTSPTQPAVRIGVVSRFAPNVIYRLYQPIMDYLNSHSNYHYALTLSESYQDAASRLQRGEVQASFLGAWMCSRLPADSGLVPVAMPINAQNQSAFHVVLVVPENSTIQSLADLTGRRVAVPSDQAYSGNWLQNGGLASVGLKESDLESIQHFQHHETVIWQVLRGNFAAGVVKESLATRNRDRGLRTVAKSPAIPGPPLVIQEGPPSREVEELIRLLLILDHDNSQDRALLKRWTPEFAYGFIPADRSIFMEAFPDTSTKKRSEP